MNVKIVIVQPEIPVYRLDFFEQLRSRLGDRLTVYASHGSLGALTETHCAEPWLKILGNTFKYREKLYWQRGAATIPIGRGDIVILSGAPRYLSNWWLFLRARALGARIVWWGHYRSSTSSGVGVWLRRTLMRLADHVLFYTDREVNQFFRDGGELERKQVSALNNGLALNQIAAYRQLYDPAQRGLNLLFIGRLTPKSRLNLLLSTLARPELAQVCLHVVGDGPERAYLQALANTLRIESQLVWHGAITNEHQIATVANQCSLFVYPGSVGLSLIHAMGYGLPAVIHSSADQHMPEFAAFEEYETGCTFEMDDTESLTQALNTALADSTRLTKWSTSALIRVSQTFNTSDMALRFERMVNLLNEKTH